MYFSATKAVAGDFEWAQSSYFTTWVYQLGYTMYEACIIALFGEDPFFIRLFNVFYSVGTTLLIYKITLKLFNPKVGKIAGLIYALFIPNIVMSSVLTNQQKSRDSSTAYYYFLG